MVIFKAAEYGIFGNIDHQNKVCQNDETVDSQYTRTAYQCFR